MPQNITDVVEFTSPCTAPTDGDPRNAAGILGHLQKLANRTRWLKNLVDGGIFNLRLVQSTGDLKALASPANGHVALLFDGGRPQFYFFRAGSALAADIDDVAYNSSAALGYWANPVYRFVSGSGSTLKWNTQIIPINKRVTQALEVVHLDPAELVLEDGVPWRNPGIPLLTTTLAVGDIVDLAADFTWSIDDAGATGKFRLYATTPDGGAPLVSSTGTIVHPIGANKRQSVHLAARFTCTVAGSHDFEVQGLTSAGGPVNISFFAPRCVRALVING